MKTWEACKSVAPGGVYAPCHDGFPQTGACYGSGGVPICLNETVCARLYDECGGKPPLKMINMGKSAARDSRTAHS